MFLWLHTFISLVIQVFNRTSYFRLAHWPGVGHLIRFGLPSVIHLFGVSFQEAMYVH